MSTTSLYVDGSVISCNPSPYGGAWAWCQVIDDQQVSWEAGRVVPGQWGSIDRITNNFTELLAALLGLESAADGWNGIIYTDSQVTMSRIKHRRKGQKPAMIGVPQLMQDRLEKVKARLGAYNVVLLVGHPSKEALARGTIEDGRPVSKHNVFVDWLCARAENGTPIAGTRDFITTTK